MAEIPFGYLERGADDAGNWIQRNNQYRPHEVLGGLPPDLYAASVR